MAEIRHRIGIGAQQDTVYEALATTEGLAGWWTRTIDGTSERGGTLRFLFGSADRSAVMDVTELDPGRRVGWRCVGGPDEWIDTDVTFDLTPGDGETVLQFTHANWSEPVEFMAHCSTKWALFLLGLKAGLEGGVATPYPNDARISTWG